MAGSARPGSCEGLRCPRTWQRAARPGRGAASPPLLWGSQACGAPSAEAAPEAAGPAGAGARGPALAGLGSPSGTSPPLWDGVWRRALGSACPRAAPKGHASIGTCQRGPEVITTELHSRRPVVRGDPMAGNASAASETRALPLVVTGKFHPGKRSHRSCGWTHDTWGHGGCDSSWAPSFFQLCFRMS